MPVIEETLHVSRRRVDTGHAVRIRKVVHQETVTVDEPLTSQFVETKRVPVGRVLSEPVGMRQEGNVTIVPVMEERLVTRKELVLVEEIHITRRQEVRRSNEQVTLRREEVIIERLDPATQLWHASDGNPMGGDGPSTSPARAPPDRLLSST